VRRRTWAAHIVGLVNNVFAAQVCRQRFCVPSADRLQAESTSVHRPPLRHRRRADLRATIPVVRSTGRSSPACARTACAGVARSTAWALDLECPSESVFWSVVTVSRRSARSLSHSRHAASHESTRAFKVSMSSGRLERVTGCHAGSLRA
jgi:hypothetical protein